MADITIDPKHTALLVLDYLVGIVSDEPRRAALANAVPVVKAARDAGVTIVYGTFGFEDDHPVVHPRNWSLTNFRAGGRFRRGHRGHERPPPTSRRSPATSSSTASAPASFPAPASTSSCTPATSASSPCVRHQHQRPGALRGPLGGRPRLRPIRHRGLLRRPRRGSPARAHDQGASHALQGHLVRDVPRGDRLASKLLPDADPLRAQKTVTCKGGLT